MKRKRSFFQWRRKPTLMDRVEDWLPEEIAARIPEQVEQALRKRSDHIDVDKLEALLADRLGKVDRAKVEELLQAGLDRLQTRAAGKEIGPRARHGLPSRDALEAAIREGIDAVLPERLERGLRERLDAIPPVNLPKPRAAVTAVEQALKSAQVPQRGAARSGAPLVGLLKGTSRLAFFSLGAWIAYSFFMIEHQVPLAKSIAADQTTLAYRPTGPLCLYRDVSNQARPLLLIHSVNAAASSYELRPVFQHFRTERPTYALDLPGFGFSARSEYAYEPATFVQAVLTAAEHAYNEAGKTPVDVVALSLGAEFAAEAARQRPDLIRALVLISPSGMQAKPTSRVDGWLYPALGFKLWARPLFDLITTRRSISYFLARSFVGMVPAEMVDYAYATAHQPDAEHAPLAFVSGRLFTPNALDGIYRKVEQPTLVIHDEDAFVTFDGLPNLVATLPNWQSARVTPTRGLPQWEKPAETNRVIAEFLESVG